MKLLSIAAEAKACRAAFAKHPDAVIALHCHHEILGERLNEPAENRIAYILSNKSKKEQALRLRLFRPIPSKLDADLAEAYTDWQKAYTDWRKADADLAEAYADWEKADADWHKAYAEFIAAQHKKLCRGCPWDGKTIFPKGGAV